MNRRLLSNTSMNLLKGLSECVILLNQKPHLMKRILLTLLLASLGLAHYAQTQAGSILVAANMSYDGSNDDRIDTAGTVTRNTLDNEFNLNVRGGYFIADNFAVGLLVGFGSSKNSTEDIFVSPAKNLTVNKGSMIHFGAFARMYKMLGESKFGVFGDVSVTYGVGNDAVENTNVNGSGTTVITKTTGKTNVLTVGLAPGVSYFFSNKFALEATIGSIGMQMTGHSDYDNAGRLDGETKETNTYVNLVPLNLGSITVGLTWFFGGGDSAAK
jgi:outer membrane immunogenic protein